MVFEPWLISEDVLTFPWSNKFYGFLLNFYFFSFWFDVAHQLHWNTENIMFNVMWNYPRKGIVEIVTLSNWHKLKGEATWRFHD